MIKKNYNNMILLRVEKSFDRLLPICALVSWASAIALYFSLIPRKFMNIDIIVGVVFALMYKFHKVLKIEIKILITISVPVLIGVLSFLDGGFYSSCITLLMISNVVAVMFLTNRKSKMISVISVGIMGGLWFVSKHSSLQEVVAASNTQWIIQIITFALYLIILHNIVFSIRKYLLENIIELESSIKKTKKLAYFDQLTGIPNQIMFREQLLKRIVKKNVSGYLVYYKMENLNLINSIYSDTLGDKVIVEAAHILNNMKKESELLARFSGSVFVFWMENLSQDEFEERMSSIIEEFQLKFNVTNWTKKIDFHISYAQYNDVESDISECYQKAALALTYAKANDEKTIVGYDKKLDEMIRYEDALKEQLKNAIMDEEFVLFYQCKVNALTNEVVGVEALARWESETLGEIGPSVFVPMIEKINFSVPFGELIVNNAFKAYRKICEKYHENIMLSINISPTHLVSNGFAEFIESAMKKHGIVEGQVMIEITEEVLIEGVDHVNEILKSLKKIGVEISLDDFGSRYSSLNYLTKLDIDELKIDKSFIDQISHSNKIMALLEMIIELSKKYNLKLVAEGVENKEQCDKLVELGCYKIQGYYFSKPESL